MKRVIAHLLLILMLSIMVTGCAEKSMPELPESKSESIRVCVDINYFYNGVDESTIKESVRYLRTRMTEAASSKGIEIPKDIEIEYIPGSGAERASAIDRIRTEIMSGGGPDLFILACDSKSPDHPEEALFIMPEKTMELGIFLPLDEYMENHTFFAEWDRMNSTVLDAGKTEEGQQIIPLCYTLPVTVFRATDVEHTASKDITRSDILNSKDEALAASALWINDLGTLANGESLLEFAPMLEFVLGGIADHQKEELRFTEEELGERLNEIVQLDMQYSDGNYLKDPAHYSAYVGYLFTRPLTDAQLAGIDYQEAHTMIPLYSDDGGVTAEITAYTAINRNTEHAEEVFRIVDYLMSYKAQRSDWLYENVLYLVGDTASMPMYDELMTEDQRVYQELLNVDGSQSGWFMPDENFAQLCNIREQITNVKFRDVLDQEFELLYRTYYEAVQNGYDPDGVVSEGYKQIQRRLGE